MRITSTHLLLLWLVTAMHVAAPAAMGSWMQCVDCPSERLFLAAIGEVSAATSCCEETPVNALGANSALSNEMCGCVDVPVDADRPQALLLPSRSTLDPPVLALSPILPSLLIPEAPPIGRLDGGRVLPSPRELPLSRFTVLII